MATTIGSLLIKLGLESGAFQTGLSSTEKQLKAATRRMAQTGEEMKQLGQRLTLGLSAPLAAFGATAFKAASDAGELQSAFDVTFGNMAASMNRWAEETGNAMERSTQEIQASAIAFQELFGKAYDPAKAADMSKRFSVLVQDLASFKNLSNDVAQQKLFAGLVGESEPLRAVGVLINETAVKARALEMGAKLVNGQLSEQDKIAARAALIMEQLAAAQGDVARTSESTANRIKAAKAAWQKFSVTVGEKLLPALTPLISKAADLLNSFSRLSPQAQSFAVGLAGVAFAAGPLLSVIGLVTTATAGFTAALGMIAGSGGVLAAASAGFAGLGAVIAPIAVPLAAVAAVGAVIYANWGKIGPVLAEFGKQAREALGPEVQQLVATLSTTLAELWRGPLGEGVRLAVASLGDLAAAYVKVFGPATIAGLKLLLSVANSTFTGITSAVQMVSRVLSGEWRAALQSAQGVFGMFSFGVTDLAAKLGQAIGHWLRDKLNQVWENLKAKIAEVKQAFFNLYDAVVGHSYVPDMVDGIAAHMARLDSVMVQPAAKGTAAVKAQFERMQADVRQIMDRLFPEAAAKAQAAVDTAKLNAAERAGNSGFTADQLRAARDRLNPAKIEQPLGDPFDLSKVKVALPEFGDLVKKVANDVEVSNVRVIESFGDMANKTLGALDRVAQSIKGGGGFLDIMSSVLGLVTQLGSIGLFGSKIAGRINAPSIPAYAGGTDWHPGGLALVGEQGPEIVNLPKGSSVTPNGQFGGATITNNFTGNLMTPEFWAQIQQGDMIAAQAGGEIGMRRMTGAQSRRLA